MVEVDQVQDLKTDKSMGNVAISCTIEVSSVYSEENKNMKTEEEEEVEEVAFEIEGLAFKKRKR